MMNIGLANALRTSSEGPERGRDETHSAGRELGAALRGDGAGQSQGENSGGDLHDGGGVWWCPRQVNCVRSWGIAVQLCNYRESGEMGSARSADAGPWPLLLNNTALPGRATLGPAKQQTPESLTSARAGAPPNHWVIGPAAWSCTRRRRCASQPQARFR